MFTEVAQVQSILWLHYLSQRCWLQNTHSWTTIILISTRPLGQNVFSPNGVFKKNENNGKNWSTRWCKKRSQVIPNSKQSFSLMFCGDATGKYLPPMVVYKSKHVCEDWKKKTAPKVQINSVSRKCLIQMFLFCLVISCFFLWVFQTSRKFVDSLSYLFENS